LGAWTATSENEDSNEGPWMRRFFVAGDDDDTSSLGCFGAVAAGVRVLGDISSHRGGRGAISTLGRSSKGTRSVTRQVSLPSPSGDGVSTLRRLRDGTFSVTSRDFFGAGSSALAVFRLRSEAVFAVDFETAGF
jgi:hypothetical protein